MGKFILIAKVVAIVGLAAVSISAWAGRAYISEIAGSVSLASGNNAPRQAVRDDEVAKGMIIRTGNASRAVLKFEDGQVVSMKANSTFKVRAYSFNPGKIEKSVAVFSMYKGEIQFVSGEIGKRKSNTFRLATPDATIGIKGADFIVAIKDNVTYSQVMSGTVMLTNAAGKVALNAGQTVSVSSAKVLPAPVSVAAIPVGIFIAAIPDSQVAQEVAPPAPSVDLTAASVEASGAEEAPVVVSETVVAEPASPAATEVGYPEVVATQAAYGDSSSDSAGFYVGALFGSVNYRYSNISNYGLVGYGFMAGYSINDLFSIEAKYSSLGGFDSTKSTLKGSSISLSGVLYYPVAEQALVFGKIGVVSTSLRETAKLGFKGSAQHNNSGIAFGFGGQYNINSKVGIRGGLDIYPVGDTVSTKTTAGLLYVGGTFKF